ncbi:unnamed protein product [Brassicogethes aeneus]|uniref:Uncharacterized protein n=1 Tax=Brassicogethes aeneus TaxID=1431903 RepID=A0A9P0B5P0_BRAAE|nr:unnamed protein product [Brassicogethes aeneus]
MPSDSNIVMDIEQNKKMLHQALVMAEVGIDMKERYLAGMKYVCYLKAVLNGADRALNRLQMISKTSLVNAQKYILNNISSCDSTTRNDYEKLLAVVEKQLNEIEDIKDIDSDYNSLSQLSEKIKNLETRQKLSDTHIQNLHSTSSKSVKSDVDEKYPENLSRESLIDLNNIANLPPVPEDIFATFSSYKPTRSSSLSSLKSMRKVKLFLQKAENSDEEDSSDAEDSDFFKLEFRYPAGMKYVCYLKAVLNGADRALNRLQMISKTSLVNAQKYILNNISSCDGTTRNDYEKLLAVVEKQLNEIEDIKDIDSDYNSLSQLSEKIKNLETRQKLSDTHIQNLHSTSSKSVKSDVDEKYPENLSRESLIDLNNIANLPPVPEDIFATFSSYKPTRSSSLSSLKSMRKVKLFLQKAENSDEEDSSDAEDSEFFKLEFGDNENQNYSSPSKKLLGNITEETQD